jgi:hypothetical protein
MSLLMDDPVAKVTNFALLHAVLHLIASCSEFVAREIDYAQLGSGKFSHAHRDRLKRTAQGIFALGLIARIISQSSGLQEQTPIRRGRSVNIGAHTEEDLSIAKHQEHAIAPKPDGGNLV